MSEETKKKTRKRSSPLDVFTAFVLVLCVAGLIVRAVIGKDGVLPSGAPDTAQYEVEFSITDVKKSLAESVSEGDVLYTEDGEVFGKIDRVISVLPSGSGDDPAGEPWEVRAIAVCEGYFAEYGFLVNGKIYASPNYELKLHTEKMTVSVTVTDIDKLG